MLSDCKHASVLYDQVFYYRSGEAKPSERPPAQKPTSLVYALMSEWKGGEQRRYGFQR
jgi:hypothetical protein